MNVELDPELVLGLKGKDPDRYWSLIAAASQVRPAVAAALVLNQELGRVADQVSQPMAGHIRLQWWREAVEEARRGRPRRHPVAMALPLIQEAGVDDASLEAMIDARERELEEAPISDLRELVEHARSTAGALQQVIATITGGDLVRACKIGTAYGLVGTLRATRHLAARGRCLLPADLLAAHDVRRDNVMAMCVEDSLRTIVSAVAGAADAEIAAISAMRREAATPLLLIVRYQLACLRELNFDPFAAATIGDRHF